MTYFNEFGQARLGWRAPSGGGGSTVDTDAQAFITAANITDSTQQSAINTLVTQLKTYGIWTKLKAVYPFVGGTASSHKFNLKDPRDLDAAFRLVFNGGMTHSNLGIVPNGTTAYADTKFNASGKLSLSSSHLSSYINDYGNGCLIGSDNLIRFWMSPRYGASNERASLFMNETTYNYFTPSTNKGFWLGSRTSLTVSKLYNNSSVYYNTNANNTGGSVENNNIFIAARALGVSTADVYFNKPISFSSIGDGLTDAEAANFYTAVQTFQTTLGRQVGVPIVSDSDAQAFLNAAVITGQTQASAINTLVTSLKSANIWTKMKAIYPFVGGTATTHKFNLKDPRDLDAAYRLVFNGGWTHSSTGAQPNGTTAYANTYLAPNAMGQNNIHVSFYSRTDTNGAYTDIGAGAGSSYVEVLSKFNGNAYMYVNTSQGDSYINPSSTGLYIANRIVAGTASLFKNNTKVINAGRAAQTPTTYNLYLGAGNYSGTATNYSPRQQAFASIGDGLTDAEATAFYNAVQAYQTTLGRQI